MATTSDKCVSWADMADEDDELLSLSSNDSNIKQDIKQDIKVKHSYASIASKGVVIANDAKARFCNISEPDFSDFIVVSNKKKDMTKKCENAVLQWAKNKGSTKTNACETNGDQEIICNRCALPFVLNAVTKEKYTERGWKMPKICKFCSQSRYEERKMC